MGSIMFSTLLLFFSSISFSSQQNPDNVICPDGKMECFPQMTCCSLKSGDYGCCPFPNATCCSDQLHCCPSETVCDMKHSMCRRKDGDFHGWVETGKPLIQTYEAATLQFPMDNTKERENEVNSEVGDRLSNIEKKDCPGGNQTCSDSYTCCMTPMGDYGCCPMIDATCCEDHIHCCPKGAFCDTASGRCVKETLSFTGSIQKNVICPGGEYQCPDRTTCCAMGGGEYGCCPLENASCCADLLHCCPEGYQCSLAGACIRSKMSNIPWLNKSGPATIPAMKLN